MEIQFPRSLNELSAIVDSPFLIKNSHVHFNFGGGQMQKLTNLHRGLALAQQSNDLFFAIGRLRLA
jgi:hypothetical protein